MMWEVQFNRVFMLREPVLQHVMEPVQWIFNPELTFAGEKAKMLYKFRKETTAIRSKGLEGPHLQGTLVLQLQRTDYGHGDGYRGGVANLNS
jgi:hypothetical protein